jgi:hypothetical protein
MSFFGDQDYPIKSMDLDGKSKLIHLAILAVIELIPCIILIAYIASTRGEIERTLSVRSADVYKSPRKNIGDTISGSDPNSNVRSSLLDM